MADIEHIDCEREHQIRRNELNIGERHGDSFVSLKDYINMQTQARDKAIDAAYKAMEKRLDGMNEFRSALQDQAKTFMPRSESDVQTQRILDSITELKADRINIATMQAKLWIIIVVGAFLTVLLTNHLLNAK